MPRNLTRYRSYVVSVLTILVVSTVCFFFQEYIQYQMTALVLLLAVSVLAILYDILPVTLAAFLSAIILNFFFIEPIFHYKISSAENLLLFFIFLLVALVNAVLTNRLKQQSKKIRDKEEKENTIRLYNTLLNSLSHELHTPISTIIAGIDTLKTHDSHISVYRKDILLQEMEFASIRLNRQVDNLLNINRLETGNLALKKDWSDINELVYLTLQKFQKEEKSRIHLHIDDHLPLFKVDSGLLEQVLYVLTHNAIIYTPQDSTIQILVDSFEEKLRIVIRDEGSGFPDEQLPYVFDKFYRLPESKPGGSGLGLSIAKGFVEAHGGTLKLENRKEGGAKFTILIPADLSYLKNLKNE